MKSVRLCNWVQTACQSVKLQWSLHIMIRFLMNTRINCNYSHRLSVWSIVATCRYRLKISVTKCFVPFHTVARTLIYWRAIRSLLLCGIKLIDLHVIFFTLIVDWMACRCQGVILKINSKIEKQKIGTITRKTFRTFGKNLENLYQKIHTIDLLG